MKDKSSVDRVDTHFGEVLAMTAGLHGVLTTTELEDADLVVAAERNDGARHGSALNEGSADLEAFFAGDSENFAESNLRAGVLAEELDLERVADVDAVLLTARLDDRVHVIKPRRPASVCLQQTCAKPFCTRRTSNARRIPNAAR